MGTWTVKYDGPCSECGATLRAGEAAIWDNRIRRMRHIECPAVASRAPVDIDAGTAGGSARRMYERGAARHDAQVRHRFGERVGGWILRFTEEPQSIRAWGIGALGEELLGAALASVPGLIVLNDRRVAGTKGNIDHIAIAPAGVFVIDAKRLEGFIEVVDKGSFFRSDLRLMVGGRNRSQLAEDMAWQLKAVNKALLDGAVDPLPPTTAVLCFVSPSWAMFRRPKSFAGVKLESEKSIVPLLTEPVVLDPTAIEAVATVLARAMPAK
jgi:hypothetical protein